MHDIDRTMQEMESDYDYDPEYNDDEFELELEYDDDELEYEEELEYDDDEEYEFELGDAGSPFTEEEELELATQLLSVNSDEELDLFLRKAFKRVGRKLKRGFKKVGKVVRSKKFRRFLKKVAKKALPIAGKAIGTYFGGPIGSRIGGKLGGFASKLFELELEGLSPEDQEFELARRYVRFAGAAMKNAANLSTRMSGDKAAKAGIKMAAKRYAPGLLKGKSAGRTASRSGRWMRRGNKIILFGA